jgi:hypothetical protein
LIIPALLGCKDWSLYKRASTAAKEDVKADAGPAKSLRGCTIAAIQGAVRPHLDKITRCYRKGVSQNPELQGRVVVRINIDASGTAKGLGVKEETLGDPEVIKCIFAVLKPLPYPYPGNEPCTVFYPFNFTASGPPSE